MDDKVRHELFRDSPRFSIGHRELDLVDLSMATHFSDRFAHRRADTLIQHGVDGRFFSVGFQFAPS